MRQFSLLLLLLCIVLPNAFAHERTRSHSVWTETNTGFTSSVYLKSRQATIFLATLPSGTPIERAYQTYLQTGLSLARDGVACVALNEPNISLRPDGVLEGRINWQCDQSTGNITLKVDFYSQFSPNHIHLVRLLSNSGMSQDFVLSRGQESISTRLDSLQTKSSFFQFVELGFFHILTGWDHIAFLLALMLLVGLKIRLLSVTLGFTLGHSLTLALAALSIITPERGVIEALIGFSIALIALEAANKRYTIPRRALLPLAIVLIGVLGSACYFTPQLNAFVAIGLSVFIVSYFLWLKFGGQSVQSAFWVSSGFGLIHGVGFAGLLLEFELSGKRLIPSLFAFNIGIEIGQLTLIFCAAILNLWVFRYLPQSIKQVSVDLLISGLGAIGVYWFLVRLFAL